MSVTNSKIGTISSHLRDIAGFLLKINNTKFGHVHLELGCWSWCSEERRL